MIHFIINACFVVQIVKHVHTLIKTKILNALVAHSNIYIYIFRNTSLFEGRCH